MVAKEYGQNPRAVADWEPEWLAAAVTVMDAEAGASRERQIRDARRARAQRGTGF